MRQVALDTETTGMDIAAGNRILEIGCIEIVQRVVTGRKFHVYLNPDRDSEPGALQVHGLTREFLADKPQFADVVDELLDFIDGAELLIHNASFDLGFLNHELKLLSRTGRIEDQYAVLDTLTLARQLHPGQRNSLDALCKRYSVDATARTLHGALLDSELLADVYLALTAGQAALSLDLAVESVEQRLSVDPRRLPRRTIVPSNADLERHSKRVEALVKIAGDAVVWRQMAP